eukprot:GEZU01014368.1.p1 GENE.GEZU01014368.1~~GEZU01014368.1.p1  ORF type:complete len:190 (+),score=37.71 GEZU01014368.1:173-742(+)
MSSASTSTLTSPVPPTLLGLTKTATQALSSTTPQVIPESLLEGNEKRKKKSDRAHYVGPKSEPKSRIFANCAFSFAGRLSKPNNEFVDLITSHDGEVIKTTTKKTSYVLTRRKAIEDMEETKDVNLCINIIYALKYETIPIVDEAFVLDSVKAGKLVGVEAYSLTAKVGMIRSSPATTVNCGTPSLSLS